MTEKTVESAAQQFADLNGSALHRTKQLTIACAGLGILLAVAVGGWYRAQVRAEKVTPVFVRIDELGRHDVVDFDEATNAAPRANEVISELRTFVIRHFSRRHIAVSRDFPESLWFLEPDLVTKAKREVEPKVKAFIAAVNAEETDVVIKHVKLVEFNRPPFKAQVDFEQQYYQPGVRTERKAPDLWTAALEFRFSDTVPHEYIQVNPFGLQITYVRVDQAFK